jgi:hypothetical protein
MDIDEMELNVVYEEKVYLFTEELDFNYITEKFGAIYDGDTKIGTISFSIIHLGQATDNGYDSYDSFEIFDNHSDYLSRVGFLIYEHEMILDEYSIDKFQYDVIVIDSIFIEEEYRGNDISVLVLKDILFRYRDAVSYFVIQAFPLDCKDLTNSVIKKIQTKLIKQYKKAGFKNIKGIDKQYLFSL